MEKTHNNITAAHIKYYRDRIDILQRRISLLTGTDRVLMTMYFENGSSFRQISRLVGMHQSNIARRIQKISKRLLEGSFILCLQNRDKLTAFELKVAKHYFINGLSMKKISKVRNTSCYRIRKAVRKINSIITNIPNDG